MDGNKRRGLLRHKHWDKRPRIPSALLALRAGAVATEVPELGKLPRGPGSQSSAEVGEQAREGGTPAREPWSQGGGQGRASRAGPERGGPGPLSSREADRRTGWSGCKGPPGNATEHGPSQRREAGEGQRRTGQRSASASERGRRARADRAALSTSEQGRAGQSAAAHHWSSMRRESWRSGAAAPGRPALEHQPLAVAAVLLQGLADEVQARCGETGMASGCTAPGRARATPGQGPCSGAKRRREDKDAAEPGLRPIRNQFETVTPRPEGRTGWATL